MIQELNLRILPQDAYDEKSIMRFLQQDKGIKPQAIRILRRSIDARQRNIYVNLTIRVYLDEQPEEMLFSPIEYKDVSQKRNLLSISLKPEIFSK